MMQLEELQRQMQARVLGQPSAVGSALVQDQRAAMRVCLDTRLGIYEHAYLSRLEAALNVNYPALQRALGAEHFSSLAQRFALGRPSSHRSIRYYGSGFSDFLAAQIPGTRGRGLCELARWEWTLAAVFDAADSPCDSRIDLVNIPPRHWPRLTFQCSRALRRLSLTTNAVKWWRPDNATLPRQWRLQRPVAWALWRHDLNVYFRSLPADEAHALDQAIAGENFGSICAALDQVCGNSAERAAAMLSGWWRDGLIIDARVS